MAFSIITRAQARAQGLTRYFTGVPCKRGHVTERQVSSITCMECDREKQRESYDPEKNRINGKRWRAANGEKIKKDKREYNKLPQRKAYASVWYQANKERTRPAKLARYAEQRAERVAYTKAWEIAALCSKRRQAAWLEDHRRIDNGGLVHHALGLALRHPVSREWKGYWQRGRIAEDTSEIAHCGAAISVAERLSTLRFWRNGMLGAMEQEPVIIVHHRVRDGWHVFTSDEMPGLYVANEDVKTAFDDVPTAIKLLVKLDFSMDVEVISTPTFAEFIAKNQRSHEADVRPHPATFPNRAYGIRRLHDG